MNDPKKYPLIDDPKEDPNTGLQKSKICRTSFSGKVTVKKIKVIRKIHY